MPTNLSWPKSDLDIEANNIYIYIEISLSLSLYIYIYVLQVGTISVCCNMFSQQTYRDYCDSDSDSDSD